MRQTHNSLGGMNHVNNSFDNCIDSACSQACIDSAGSSLGLAEDNSRNTVVSVHMPDSAA